MSEVEVSERIEARPQRVWGLIADPTSMDDLTAECTAMEWASGSTGPAVGARFRGKNRSGWRRWTTTCTIVSYEPGAEIAWDVAYGPLAVARWGYRLEPGDTDETTVLHERFEDHRGGLMRAVGPLVRGTRDAETLNRGHMRTTLERIKDKAEA
jgi:Polyketide cyclase / dehydrase and lipid transport